MAEISNEYIFPPEFSIRLKQKFEVLKLSHVNWGDDDIEDIRVAIRNFYRGEQKGKCAYCRSDLSLRSASNCSIEHIAPKSKYLGFISTAKNLCVVCADCNENKGSKDVFVRPNVKRYPKKSSDFLIYHPHFDIFTDHFDEKSSYVIGKTKKAEYTIYVCDLNRIYKRFGIPAEDPDNAELHQLFFSFIDERDNFKRKVFKEKLLQKLE